jgi:hypothetical protein
MTTDDGTEREDDVTGRGESVEPVRQETDVSDIVERLADIVAPWSAAVAPLPVNIAACRDAKERIEQLRAALRAVEDAYDKPYWEDAIAAVMAQVRAALAP